MRAIRLLDERSDPALRAVIGELLAGADAVDLAVARIRLANLDLSEREVSGPRRCRVLLGHLDASTLLDASAARQESVDRLARWTRSGRLEVRSAGIGRWTPDFSVYHAGDGGTCLLGAHYFGNPHLNVGPSFTAVITDQETRGALAARFDRLWRRSHDVLPAIAQVLEGARVGATVAP